MTKTSTLATLIALALLTGCASTGQTSSAPPTTAAAGQPTTVAVVTAPAQPLRVPAASAKKVVLNMTGPAAVTQAKDWSAFKEEWRTTFADHAKASGVAFDIQRGEAKAGAEAGTLLNVYVNDYRQVGIGARIFLGVMTGNAYIDGKVAFSDLTNGARFGEQSYNTTSSAWSGVFGKMTPQQVDAIATEVFASLKTR